MRIQLLKKYASTLLKNYLDDVSELYFIKAKENNEVTLNQYFHLSEDIQRQQFKNETEIFLTQIIESDIVKGTQKFLEELWSIRGEISTSELLAMYFNRKHALIHFINKFTRDPDEIIAIVKEIEDVFIIQEIISNQHIEEYNRKKKETLDYQVLSASRENKHYLNNLESISHLAHCEINYSTKEIQCTREFYKIVGIDINKRLSLDELNGMFIKENGYSPFVKKINQQFKIGKANLHVFKIKTNTDEIKELASFDYPLTDQNNFIIGVRSFIQDITELKNIDEKIHNSQFNFLFQKIVEYSPTTICIFNLEENKFDYVNYTGNKILGYPKNKLLEMNYEDVLDLVVLPEDIPSIKENRKKITHLKDREFIENQVRLLDSDAKMHWVTTRTTVFKRTGENVSQVLVNIIEITDLKKTEIKLLEKQTLLEKIAHTIPNTIFIYDIKKQADVYSNRNIMKELGYSPNQIKWLGKHFLLKVFHPDDRRKTIEFYKGFKHSPEHEIRESENRIKDNHGNWRWFQVRATPFLRNEKQEVIQVLGIAQDITARKKMEEEIKSRETQLIEAQEVAHVGTFDWDLKTDIGKVSEEFCRIFEFPLNKRTIDFSMFENKIKPSDQLYLEAKMKMMYRKPIKRIENEYSIITSDNKEKNILSRFKIIRDKDNTPVKMYGAIMDITSFKQAQAELEVKERELKFTKDELLEAQNIGSIGSFQWNIKTNKVTGSQEFYRIFGLEGEKPLKLSDFTKLLDEENLKHFNSNLKKALQTKRTYESEYRITILTGEEKYIIIRSRNKYNSEGKPTKIIGSLMDITNLKKAKIQLLQKNKEISAAYNKLKSAQDELTKINQELDERVRMRTKELKVSYERYNTFIKQSTEGIWRYDLGEKGKVNTNSPLNEQIDKILNHAYFAECNEKMALMHGYKSVEELENTMFYDFQFSSREDKIEMVKKFIQSGYRLNDLRTVEKDKQGNIHFMRTSLVGIIENNILLGAWGIQKDITEQTIANNALKESEARYRFLADTVPNIFWTSNPKGKIDFFNKKWYEYTGSQSHDNLDWKPFLHPDDCEKSKIIWAESLKTEESYEMEYRLRGTDGIYRWHLGRAVPLKDKKGRVIKWFGTAMDIHEQKKSSDKLKKRNEELIKANNELDNFIYSVSHDLKGPISNLEGLLSSLNITMNDEPHDEEIDEIITMMSESIQKFRSNLTDLIEMAKAEKNSNNIIEDIKFYDIQQDIESIFEETIKKSNIKVISDFTAPQIKFSRKNLRSIIYNLFSNAIKYRSNERESFVKVSTKKCGKYTLLAVEDNGLGFDQSQAEEIFTKRLHKHIEGSGVGLYITRKIIQNAGGKMEIESEKNKGSIFKVYLKNEL